MVGDEQGQVRFQRRFLDVQSRLVLFFDHEVVELLFLQFFDGLGKDALVHVEAEVVDEPALFRA